MEKVGGDLREYNTIHLHLIGTVEVEGIREDMIHEGILAEDHHKEVMPSCVVCGGDVEVGREQEP